MDRTVFAAFIRDLLGEAGLQFQFYPPADLEDAIRRVEPIEQAKATRKQARNVVSAASDDPMREGSNVNTVEGGVATTNGRKDSCTPAGNLVTSLETVPEAGQREAGSRGQRDGRFYYVSADPAHFAAECFRMIAWELRN